MHFVSSTIHLPFFHDSVSSKCPRTASSLSMDSDFLKKETSLQLLTLKARVPRQKTVTFCHLNFGRKQPSPEELGPHESLEFRNFIAREAFLNEEYWIAAALRAEHKMENKSRYNHYEKRIHTIEEYDKIKKHCREPQPSHSSTCIIAVKKQVKDVTRIVLRSVVGTLDLNIRCLQFGESYPRERVNATGVQVKERSSSRYGYIANVCVAKSYRRKGIASNMLCFAVKYAKSRGVNSVYAHVNRNDGPALALFQKLGFK
ncbi:hypothetical protein V8G54_013708, partial [Vigna mungo]